MSPLVIDASIAIKWVVEETGTSEALALRDRAKLVAPDLLVPECANILWKKIRRGELTTDEGLLAAQLLSAAEIDIAPTRSLLASATRLAVALDHPAYDCVYIALAIARDCSFVTADERLLRRVQDVGDRAISRRVVPLSSSSPAS